MDEKIIGRNNIQIYKSSQLYTEKGRISWIRRILSSVTVEPSLFLCILPSIMYQMVTINLYLEKTCRVHLALNRTVCEALSERRTSGYELEEATVQNYVAEMSAISTFIQGFFPFCLILFVGSWSDKHGRRRPLILTPIFGEIVSVISLILNVVYYDELPVIFIAISVALPTALTGGWPCLFLGIYSHISVLADDTNKTAKIGISSTIQNVGFIIGLGSSGFLLAPLGFIGIYIVCLMMLLVSFFYGYFNIEEKKLEREEETSEIRKRRNDFMDILRLEHLKSTIRTCFAKGHFIKRRRIFIILFLCIIILGPMQGENTVAYLYTRLKYGWNEQEFSFFFIIHSIFDIIGSSIAIVLLSKIFEWKDTSIGILALCTTVTSNFIYAFATDYRYFYGGILFDIFYTIPPIILRSLMAKMVPQDELGRSNSLLGLSEALVPSIFGPLYSTVYKNTMNTFPGSFYFVSISMYSLSIFVLIYLYRDTSENRNDFKESEKLKNKSHEDMES